MTNENQARTVRYIRFSEAFSREEAIQKLRRTRENGAFIGRIFHSIYMDMVSFSLRNDGKIILKGMDEGYPNAAAEICDMICAQDTEIPMIAAAVQRMAQLGLIHIVSADGEPLTLQFALVDRYSKTLTQGAIDKAEKAGKPTGLVIDAVNPPEIEGPVEEKKTRGKSKKQQEAEELFERLWRMYPRKRDKDRVKPATKIKLLAAGEDKCSAAIDQYKREIEGRDPQYTMYGGRFFSSRIFEMMDDADAQVSAAQTPQTPQEMPVTQQAI